ncbi:major allergen Pru ar 1 [Ziziphus jujuba]|uniref:Major allergen Pru ar 1 n=2 Tax=Ziziphus jujuba TaxID=326968 RepID=A0ABM3IXW5_ZIZJJ|nr:major allergen Pru ar 1 [Ziziphus jujuba]KAH7517022.1 hypothetical protein FEM48_Zijuj09G0017800 [Ziziphus jujuba var. spinosa]
MGVTTLRQEFASLVPADRMFKAIILDSHNLVHKLMPQAIKSIEIIHGDGGQGTIKQTNFAEGTRYRYMKHRIDALDVENLTCKYSLIEGDVLSKEIEYIAYEVKFESNSNGGCVCYVKSEYHTVGDMELNEEDLKAGKERAIGMFKVVEAYLFENPAAYA